MYAQSSLTTQRLTQLLATTPKFKHRYACHTFSYHQLILAHIYIQTLLNTGGDKAFINKVVCHLHCKRTWKAPTKSTSLLKILPLANNAFSPSISSCCLIIPLTASVWKPNAYIQTFATNFCCNNKLTITFVVTAPYHERNLFINCIDRFSIITSRWNIQIRRYTACHIN